MTTDGYTISYAPIIPSPTTINNPVPNPTWASSHKIGQSQLYLDEALRGYAKFKCQFQCGVGCESWFVGFVPNATYWTCIQYHSLLMPPLLVASPGNATVSGVAFNKI